MTRLMMLSAALMAAVVMVGCKSNAGSVADVPPPKASSPITASPDALTPPSPSAAAPAAGANDATKAAAAGPAKPGAAIQGNSYVVRQGDTLWSIAKSRYGDGKKFKDIITANPGLTAEKLQVGMAINLP